MKRIRAFDIVTSEAWAIHQPALENILTIIERHESNIEALATRIGEPLNNTRTVELIDRVAIVPIVGPIMRYANLFTEISGATSTQVLATDIQAALDDSQVRAIVLNIDSPGGQADGISELAQMIHGARGKKPIVAYGGGRVQSAAYWIGSAARDLVLNDTAMVGSIGAVMTLVLDNGKRAEARGERRVEFVSSSSPDKRPDVDTNEGRAKIQALVDKLGDIFIDTVALHRGVSSDKVRSDFGRGGTLVGLDAVKVGMADRLGSLASVIAEFGITNRSFFMKGKSIEVRTTAELLAASAAGHDIKEISIAAADVDAIKTAARAEGGAEGERLGLEKGMKAGAEAERARIKGIQAIAMPGFEKELAAAIDDGSSVEAASVAILKAAKDRGITLTQISADGKAVPFAPALPPTSGGDAKKLRGQSIFESRAQAAAKK